MELSTDTLSIIFISAIALTMIAGIIYMVTHPQSRKGGMNATTMFGSTYEFYDIEKREAIEHILEEQAGKKMEEQSSDEPE